MKICRVGFAVFFFTAFGNMASALSSERDAEEMNAIARTSGCYLCHNVEPRKPAVQEILPYGPAWTDIAKKYKTDANAAVKLTQIIRQGSGKTRAERHWQGKTSVAGMQPNSVEITEADAGKLASWILSLGK